MATQIQADTATAAREIRRAVERVARLAKRFENGEIPEREMRTLWSVLLSDSRVVVNRADTVYGALTQDLNNRIAKLPPVERELLKCAHFDTPMHRQTDNPRCLDFMRQRAQGDSQ